ncbi:unnamed protein product, partial [Symbiodinium sp. CCMP2456]
MESDNGPDYGHVSPAENDADVSLSAGNPEWECETGEGSRDDAGAGATRDGDQGRSPEDDARDLLDFGEGLEPPYEYMSVEGSPERGDQPVPGEELKEVGTTSSSDQSKARAERPSPMLNGVGPSGPGNRHREGGRRLDEPAAAGGGSGLVFEMEDVIRQLVAQNQALQEELVAAKQG